MLVWPAGIGHHVCLSRIPPSVPHAFAWRMVLVLCIFLLASQTRATARGENPKTANDKQPETGTLVLWVVCLCVVWLVGFFWINSQERDPRTRRGSRPPAAI